MTPDRVDALNDDTYVLMRNDLNAVARRLQLVADVLALAGDRENAAMVEPASLEALGEVAEGCIRRLKRVLAGPIGDLSERAQVAPAAGLTA
jgi:hypothetical protein